MRAARLIRALYSFDEQLAKHDSDVACLSTSRPANWIALSFALTVSSAFLVLGPDFDLLSSFVFYCLRYRRCWLWGMAWRWLWG